MKTIFYIQGMPFGEFFYDMESRKGVAMRSKLRDPVVLGMSEKYDPLDEPGVKVLYVEPEIFNELLDAGANRSRPDAIRLAAFLRGKTTT